MTRVMAAHLRTRSLAGLLLGLVLLLALGATRPAGAGVANSDLPPSRLPALAKRFESQVEPLGLTVSRGKLQNLDTYETDPEGTHLALYVEPIDADYTSAQYVENFTKLTRKLVPAVFKRWKGLESFDICQEPFADGRDAPPPVTQIFVTRDALDRVGSWRTTELAELLAASPRTRSTAAGYYVYFSPTVRSDPAFVAAAAEAGWTAPTTGVRY